MAIQLSNKFTSSILLASLFISIDVINVDAKSFEWKSLCSYYLSFFGFKKNKHIDPYTLLNAGRTQEALWLLADVGEEIAAEGLKSEIIEKIRSGNPIKNDILEEGAHNDGIWHLDSGVAGIFKRLRYQNEIAAYRLDQLIGLNRVPITIEKKIGTNIGSFQIWIEKATHQSKSLNSDTVAQNEANFFNAFIENIDGYLNTGNIVYTSEGRRLLIDAGHGFFQSKILVDVLTNKDPLKVVPRRSVFYRFKELTEVDIRATLSDCGFSDAQILSLLERKKLIVKKIDDLVELYGAKNVFPKSDP